jgi:hypothetical protein
MSKHLYRIVLVCSGVPAAAGLAAATGIAQHFVEHRPWHENVSCSWDGSRLILQVENDFDSNGLATWDEFSDCICAFVPGGFDGEIKLESISIVEQQ